ncbi:MAG: phospho-sugar mutase, partial [Bacteroidota bacterium]
MENLSSEVQENVNQWLSGNYDEETKASIQQMLDEGQTTALTDAFYKDLEFGTGGLRGIMGIGSNRINQYTVGMATQGLANYLIKSFPGENIKVAIAHDSRNRSSEFARITANVFSANGIHVYLFKELRPTPELSFAIRHLGCKSGVVITASHNPKEYNGYKAYWDDGAQVVPPHDKNIIEEVKKVGVDDIKFEPNESNIEMVGENIDEVYLKEVVGLSLSPEAIQRQKDLKIVFTPIHGTSITLVPTLLEKMGFRNVHTVEEQSNPDGDFPTVVYPNPEEAEALSIGLKKSQELDADILMGTDPDSDRVGIAVKNHHGEWQLLNGNQTGALLIDYLVGGWQRNGKLDGKQ